MLESSISGTRLRTVLITDRVTSLLPPFTVRLVLAAVSPETLTFRRFSSSARAWSWARFRAEAGSA